MPGTNELAAHLAYALAVGLEAALPVVAIVAAAAFLGSFVQAFVGFGDPAIGLAFRVAGATVALVVFGAWIVGVITTYWTWAWGILAQAMGAGG